MSSSDSATPSDPTLPTSTPASSSSSDSAPPPSTPALPLPPRNYSHAPLILPSPPRYAPNSTVPIFLRTLALVVLLAGVSGAGLGWLYRRIVYPRLVLALEARRRLVRAHEGVYDKLLEAIRGLGAGKGMQRITGRGAGRKEFVGEKDRREAEAREGASASQSEQDDDEVADTVVPRPEPLLDPLLDPLSSLASHLRSSSPAHPLPSPSHASSHVHPASNPSNLVQPTGTLLRSLVTFNEYLEDERYRLGTVHGYRGSISAGVGGGAGAGKDGSERDKWARMVGEVKGEVRALKGALFVFLLFFPFPASCLDSLLEDRETTLMKVNAVGVLLNRRNFTTPAAVSSAA
ncbi:hypothetical protein JCM11641_006214 [Rhodosporidiobolus odoratus]